jgi:hypothetical protein
MAARYATVGYAYVNAANARCVLRRDPRLCAAEIAIGYDCGGGATAVSGRRCSAGWPPTQRTDHNQCSADGPAEGVLTSPG